MFQGPERRPNDLKIYGDHFLEETKHGGKGWKKVEARRPKGGGPRGQGPSGPPWLRLRRSFFSKLPRDLKTTIKIVPRRFPEGGGRETQNHETEDRRLPPEKIGGRKRRRNHLRRSSPSPSGVSINTTAKTSTISITIFVIDFIPLIV